MITLLFHMDTSMKSGMLYLQQLLYMKDLA